MATKRFPVVGIITFATGAGDDGRPPRLSQNQSYVRALSRAGAAPLLIPHLTDDVPLRTLYDLLDGLLLPGGGDVDPAHYGEPPHARTANVSLERDEVELTLARWAVDEGKPLLAVCRGIQVLNVALGGSLYQDIEAQVPGAGKHDWYPGYPRDHRPHAVIITAGTRLARIVGSTEQAVNSLHHQAIKDVAPGLTITARATDGVVEAVEATEHPFVVAVQWHPEELAPADPRAQALFDALVAACRR